MVKRVRLSDTKAKSSRPTKQRSTASEHPPVKPGTHLLPPETTMIVNINNQYRIRSDGLQYIVERKKVTERGPKSGTERWISEAYCSYLDDAIIFFAKHRMKMIRGMFGAEAIQQMATTLDEIKAETRTTLQEFIERGKKAEAQEASSN